MTARLNPYFQVGVDVMDQPCLIIGGGQGGGAGTGEGSGGGKNKKRNTQRGGNSGGQGKPSLRGDK